MPRGSLPGPRMGAQGQGCAVPSDLPGLVKLRDRAFELPAFDFESLTNACGSTENAKCGCWKRP